jgi:hypothetical protein
LYCKITVPYKNKPLLRMLDISAPRHLLGHAIKSVTCFDLQFWHSTRPMTSFCIFIGYMNTGNSFQRQNYKMRLKQKLNKFHARYDNVTLSPLVLQ